jgi:hypothetical protein
LFEEAGERGDTAQMEKLREEAETSFKTMIAIIEGRQLVNPMSPDRERESDDAFTLRRMNEVNRINEINQEIARQREVLRRMNEMNEQNALLQRSRQGRQVDGPTNQQNVFSGAVGTQIQRSQAEPTLRETLEPRYDPRVNPPRYDIDDDDD